MDEAEDEVVRDGDAVAETSIDDDRVGDDDVLELREADSVKLEDSDGVNDDDSDPVRLRDCECELLVDSVAEVVFESEEEVEREIVPDSLLDKEIVNDGVFVAVRDVL